MLGSLSVPEHPTGATFVDRYVDQTVAREATPCLELGADAWIAADHGHEVALTAAAERSYQVWQQARGKCLGAGVKFNARVRSHALYYSFCLKKSKTVWGLQAHRESAADESDSRSMATTVVVAGWLAAFTSAKTTSPPSHSITSDQHEVRFGSKPEKLYASICCPLLIQ